MKSLAKNLAETINPKGGKGLIETIIFVILIVAITYLTAIDCNVPKEFLLALGVLVGYITGNSKGGKSDD